MGAMRAGARGKGGGGRGQGPPTCSSSCTMLRLLFSTAWMSGERPLLMSCGGEGRALSLSESSDPTAGGPHSHRSGGTETSSPAHPRRRSPTPAPALLGPPLLLAASLALAPSLTTASMSAPRSSKSSTASWHSVFTATCRAVSPKGEGGPVKHGLGTLQPQKAARSCQTAPPCARARVCPHRHNFGPPGPLCPGPRCPAGPAGKSGCGAHTPSGLLSGHGGPVPWGWHRPSPVAGPPTAKW